MLRGEFLFFLGEKKGALLNIWFRSPDWQCLMVSSRNGYCTLVTFDEILPAHHVHAAAHDSAAVDCEPPFGAAGVLCLFFGADGDDDNTYGDTGVGDYWAACFADAAGCGAGSGPGPG